MYNNLIITAITFNLAVTIKLNFLYFFIGLFCLLFLLYFFICFICFGPIAISAAYYSQAQSYSVLALITSILVGISTSIILFCSHFHQVEDDLAAGKRSPIVRLGTKTGANVLLWSTASIFILTVIWIVWGYFSLASLLIFLAIPWAYKLVRHVQQYHDQPEKVSNSKFIAVEFYLWSSVFLGLGIAMN